MANSMSKNIPIDAISNIEKECIEHIPVEITIQPSIDNHDKTRTVFVTRSASAEPLITDKKISIKTLSQNLSESTDDFDLSDFAKNAKKVKKSSKKQKTRNKTKCIACGNATNLDTKLKVQNILNTHQKTDSGFSDQVKAQYQPKPTVTDSKTFFSPDLENQKMTFQQFNQLQNFSTMNGNSMQNRNLANRMGDNTAYFNAPMMSKSMMKSGDSGINLTGDKTVGEESVASTTQSNLIDTNILLK